MNNMSESSVLQSAPYKCLQSQFSVLYGEVTQVNVGRVNHVSYFLSHQQSSHLQWSTEIQLHFS